MFDFKKIEDVVNVMDRDNSDLNRGAVLNDVIIGAVFTAIAASLPASIIIKKLVKEDPSYYPSDENTSSTI